MYIPMFVLVIIGFLISPELMLILIGGCLLWKISPILIGCIYLFLQGLKAGNIFILFILYCFFFWAVKISIEEEKAQIEDIIKNLTKQDIFQNVIRTLIFIILSLVFFIVGFLNKDITIAVHNWLIFGGVCFSSISIYIVKEQLILFKNNNELKIQQDKVLK